MKFVRGLLFLALSLVVGSGFAGAQGGATSSITGVVTDAGGGVLPGASVVATSAATGTKFEAVANNTGGYTMPALSAGVYTVTFSIPGFKTRVFSDVRVQLAIPTTLNAALEIGEVSETITVSGGASELINSATPAVTATLNVEQIAVIPTPTRNALNAVTSWSASTHQAGCAGQRSTVCRSRSST